MFQLVSIAALAAFAVSDDAAVPKPPAAKARCENARLHVVGKDAEREAPARVTSLKDEPLADRSLAVIRDASCDRPVKVESNVGQQQR
jgi:hypothetical protein